MCISSKINSPSIGWAVYFGAGDQIRTDYLVITNDVLYLLSYTSIFIFSTFSVKRGTLSIIDNLSYDCKRFFGLSVFCLLGAKNAANAVALEVQLPPHSLGHTILSRCTQSFTRWAFLSKNGSPARTKPNRS